MSRILLAEHRGGFRRANWKAKVVLADRLITTLRRTGNIVDREDAEASRILGIACYLRGEVRLSVHVFIGRGPREGLVLDARSSMGLIVDKNRRGGRMGYA
jgi:hypothetical protein